MGIAYVTGTQNVVLSCNSRKTILDHAANTCFLAGCTIVQKPMEARLTISGTISNGDSITLRPDQFTVSDITPVLGSTVTYTFRTSINNAVPNEVLIAGSANGNLTNLAAAIVGVAGSGTQFSSATVPSAIVSTTSQTLSTIVFYRQQAGPSYFMDFQKSGTNLAWDNFGYPGWVISTLLTPEGLRFKIYGIDTGQADLFASPNRSKIRWIISDIEGNTVSSSIYGPTSGMLQQVSVGGQLIRVIANSYGFTCYSDGISGGSGADELFFCGQVKPFDNYKAFQIASCDNLTPATITLGSNHNWVTGDTVYVHGALGNLGINGQHQVTVTGSNSAILNASASTGTYTSGGYVGAVGRQIAQAFWAISNSTGGFRQGLHVYAGNCITAINGTIGSGIGGDGGLCITTAAAAIGQNNDQSLTHYDGSFMGTEALLQFAQPNTSTGTIMGQMHNGLIIRGPFAKDELDSIDSHTFLNFTDNNAVGANAGMVGSLFLNTTG